MHPKLEADWHSPNALPCLADADIHTQTRCCVHHHQSSFTIEGRRERVLPLACGFFSAFFPLSLPHRLLQKTVPVARVRTVDGDAPSRGPFAKTGRYQRSTALQGQDSRKKRRTPRLQLPET
ncbi:Uncharacterized protein HZ326_23563 [Fusarium oxysporum f. sp. albedinis]|nr:Uncharacterized protein HZ326_23563 [Fusarium oxysporum f. sp. albedinis]